MMQDIKYISGRLRLGNLRIYRSQHPSRDFLLHAMPKNSICAEIGVHEGEFSRRILDIVNPRRLHLIDPWKYEEDELYSKALYGGKAGVSQAHLDARYLKVVER